MTEKRISALHKELLHALHDEQRLSDIHQELAENYADLGNYSDAIDHLKQALNLPHSVLERAKLQRLLGEAYIELGRTKEAGYYLREYLKNAADDRTELQRAYLTLGRYLYICGMDLKAMWPSGSLEMLKEAEEMTLKSLSFKEGGKETEARLLLNLALIKEELGGAREAAGYLRRSREIAEKANLHEELYRCLSATCSLFRRHGGAARAVEVFSGPAMNAARKAGAEIHCQCALELAEFQLYIGDINASKETLQNALKLKNAPKPLKETVAEKLKAVSNAVRYQRELHTCDEGRACVLNNRLANFYISFEMPDLAISHLQFLLKQSLPTVKLEKVHYMLGVAFRELNRFEEALHHFEAACKLRVRADTFREIGLCKLRLLRPYNEIMQHLNDAVAVGEGHAKVRAYEQILYVKKSFGMDASDDEIVYEKMKKQFQDVDEDASGNEGSDTSSEYNEPSSSSEENEMCQSFPMKRNAKGETKLHEACIRGNLRLVQRLIETERHPVNVRDYNGWLPLHEAVNFNHLEIVEYLLDRGAAINDRGADENTTPLHDACQNGLLDMIELLLAKGAEPAVRNASGLTPLDLLVSLRIKEEESCNLEEIKRCRSIEEKMLAKIKEVMPSYTLKIMDSSDSEPQDESFENVTSEPNLEELKPTDMYKSVINDIRHKSVPKPSLIKKSRLSAFVSDEYYHTWLATDTDPLQSSGESDKNSPEKIHHRRTTRKRSDNNLSNLATNTSEVKSVLANSNSRTLTRSYSVNGRMGKRSIAFADSESDHSDKTSFGGKGERSDTKRGKIDNCCEFPSEVGVETEQKSKATSADADSTEKKDLHNNNNNKSTTHSPSSSSCDTSAKNKNVVSSKSGRLDACDSTLPINVNAKKRFTLVDVDSILGEHLIDNGETKRSSKSSAVSAATAVTDCEARSEGYISGEDLISTLSVDRLVHKNVVSSWSKSRMWKIRVCVGEKLKLLVPMTPLRLIGEFKEEVIRRALKYKVVAVGPLKTSDNCILDEDDLLLDALCEDTLTCIDAYSS